MAPRVNTPRDTDKARASAKRSAPMATAIHIDNGERQLVGQIFCGVLALFGVLIAVISILVSLYADAQAETAEAYVRWGLIVTTTLAIILSSITAGGAMARRLGMTCRGTISTGWCMSSSSSSPHAFSSWCLACAISDPKHPSRSTATATPGNASCRPSHG